MLYQGLAVKLPSICKELVKQLLLCDLVLFKLYPGSGVLSSQQLLCKETSRQPRKAEHTSATDVATKYAAAMTARSSSC